MNNALKVGGGLMVACAACCAVPIVPALLAGTGLAALGTAAWAWGGVVAVLAAIAAGGMLYLMRRRISAVSVNPSARAPISSARTQGCGCGSSGKQES